MIANYYENLSEKKKIVIAYCLFILVAVIAVTFHSPMKSVDTYKISATPVNDPALPDRVRMKHSSNKSDFEQSDDSNYAMQSKTKYFKSYFADETNGSH